MHTLVSMLDLIGSVCLCSVHVRQYVCMHSSKLRICTFILALIYIVGITVVCAACLLQTSITTHLFILPPPGTLLFKLKAVSLIGTLARCGVKVHPHRLWLSH